MIPVVRSPPRAKKKPPAR